MAHLTATNLIAPPCFILRVTAKPAAPLETVRIATPGKLIDFAVLYAVLNYGIYRQEGLDPSFVVCEKGSSSRR